ncbi:COP9 signalosome complex subunit 3 [Coemansia spiralis]|uniref:COP9 signalosome complex subunit 3 n=2 Tax=Coemansia TaxID=4863 RepID=A0A9W8G621_9FUNG|nr:COP9 signalosome complex subunit 3 [Coemansia umbellata]KAJ2618960.1 COP9 signalosome complex subunit 3 [Coemansia sp. RSA 1358]KAJ2675031.1 COP9 signalosome complex subunit 3 [Coemansia spiralis]
MVWSNATAQSADAYNALVSIALDAANSRLNLNNLLSRLRDWHSPLRQFNAGILDTILGSLDTHNCTLVVAQILVDMLNLAERPEDFGFTFEHLNAFAREMRLEQLTLFHEMLLRLSRALCKAAEATGDYALVCGHLITIVSEINRQMAETRQAPMTLEDIKQHKEKLGSNGNAGVRLTPLHIECLRQCLLANQMEVHQRVTEQVLQIRFDAIGKLCGSRARAFMEYHCYAGMVYVGTGQMDQALLMWQLVFALPTVNVSHIQQVTYKRFTLLHFLVHGAKGGLPAFFASSHTRVVESSTSSYTALIDSCVARRIDLAAKLFRDMRAELISDNNLGLATRLINSLPMHCIHDQASVYSCVRLDALASLIGFSAHPLAQQEGVLLADALGQYIQEMGDSSVVLEERGDTAPFFMVVRFVDSKATVQSLHSSSNDTGVLTVSPDGSNGIGTMRLLPEHEWSSAIAAKVSETNVLRRQLLELDRHLALTLEYVAHTRD